MLRFARVKVLTSCPLSRTEWCNHITEVEELLLGQICHNQAAVLGDQLERTSEGTSSPCGTTSLPERV